MEKKLTKNCVCGDKITNIRYGCRFKNRGEKICEVECFKSLFDRVPWRRGGDRWSAETELISANFFGKHLSVMGEGG